MADAFSHYHPLVNFSYFTLVLAFCMTLMHPLCLLISLSCALYYAIQLRGLKAVRLGIYVCLPTLLLAVVINPAFNHAGGTVIAYLPSGNPLTLESILYGLAAGVMLCAVLLWFTCFNEIITSDKFVYLFGKIAPSLSLVLSMTLRFIPRFKAQMDNVRQAQYGIGRDILSGSIISRLKKAVTVFSITVTWALENAIETADSMKGRGYGLKGRTAFSIYRIESRDKQALLWLLFCGVYLICGILADGLDWWYFPILQGAKFEPFSISLYIIYLALCLTPVVINGRERYLWRLSVLKA